MKDKQIKSAEGKVFFDSNILVYYADESDARKQKIATALIKDAIDSGNGVISTQCLQEFYNVVTKKLLCDKEKAKIDEDFATMRHLPEFQEPIAKPFTRGDGVFTDEEIAPLFEAAHEIDNIVLPENW